MAANHSHQPYTFGDFRFDPVTGTLERGHEGIPLPRQPAMVLALLLDNAGQLVTREQLIAAVWGDGTTVVYADALNFCIRQVRQALGESARAPVLIETFPKRGYRFARPVSRTTRSSVVHPPAAWAQMAAVAALVALVAVSAPARVGSDRGSLARIASSEPLTPLLSATLRQADLVLQLTLGSIEAHLSGGACPWPSYWSAARRSA